MKNDSNFLYKKAAYIKAEEIGSCLTDPQDPPTQKEMETFLAQLNKAGKRCRKRKQIQRTSIFACSGICICFFLLVAFSKPIQATLLNYLWNVDSKTYTEFKLSDVEKQQPAGWYTLTYLPQDYHVNSIKLYSSLIKTDYTNENDRLSFIQTRKTAIQIDTENTPVETFYFKDKSMARLTKKNGGAVLVWGRQDLIFYLNTDSEMDTSELLKIAESATLIQ